MQTRDERIYSLHAGYTAGSDYVDGFLARPTDGTPRPGVILLSGMYGMSWNQRELTRMYARAGFVALSPDYLGGAHPTDQVSALHAKNSLDVNRAVYHISAGVDFLRSLPWVGSEGRVGILGFCLGGGLVLLSMGRTRKFDAGVVYHQSLFPDHRELETLNGRLQCHYGTNDHSTPREEVDAFTRALDRYEKEHEVHWYDGMGHSFAQIGPDAEVPWDQRQASNLSHERSYDFLWRELGSAQRAPSPPEPVPAGAEPGPQTPLPTWLSQEGQEGQFDRTADI